MHKQARPQEDRTNVVSTQRDPLDRPRRFATLSDCQNSLTFLLLALVAKLIPVRKWSDVSRFMAAVHLRLRGPKRPYRMAVSALKLSRTAWNLEQEFLTGVYEDIIYTMREKLPGGWESSIRLHGRQHVDEALERGKGAVLWLCPTTHGGLVIMKSLHEAGIRTYFLRGESHPYSGTRVGMRFLNPIRTSTEDRWVKVIRLAAGQEKLAVDSLKEHLKQNHVIAIAAIGAGRRTLTIPFLGGDLIMALGAPRLALKAGAALLPVFASPAERGGFEVSIEPPLPVSESCQADLDPEPLARQYAKLLEAYVSRHPAEWRGWGHQWKAGDEDPK